MRIAIDLQGAQTPSSRFRGIGRYSLALAKAIIRQQAGHEILIALNGSFADSVEPLRAEFEGLLPQDNIRVWYPTIPTCECQAGNDWRRRSSEMLREAFLASLQPDVVLVSSMFEGHGDNTVTSIGQFARLPTAVILYDLIPFIHRDIYLNCPSSLPWYFRKIDHFRRADLWLAISESSRREGIDSLGLPSEAVVNISGAADRQFKPERPPASREAELRARYGLNRSFIMASGGMDRRKNVERLIRAYSRLDPSLRRKHQLALTFNVNANARDLLLSEARESGLGEGELVITGYVQDRDLVDLYNLCHLFVMPSWHEGFGLPVLEAMQCGAPVLTANATSLPEIVGNDRALFDPHSEASIAAKLTEALTNEDFRLALADHGLQQACRFSWEKTAKKALTALERLHERKCEARPSGAFRRNERRPKLAYLSPIPPERSGIADYSAGLLPELARHYDIEIISDQPAIASPEIAAAIPLRPVEWFRTNAERYDRVLYHIGNSHFHEHIFRLLEHIPGVTVLHDFFVSNALQNMHMRQGDVSGWLRALYKSHGYAAIAEHVRASDKSAIPFRFPCNFSILKQSLGVIVHSQHAKTLAEEWYGVDLTRDWAMIPLLRAPGRGLTREEARKELNLDADDILVCSFGIIHPAKQSHRLAEAWLQSSLTRNAKARLVFAGQGIVESYDRQLAEYAAQSGPGRIEFTGWLEPDRYRLYLAAADVAVQLRTLSRGETSAAALDCLSWGIPTIVNAHGSMAELPADRASTLPDEFTNAELVAALERLCRDSGLRESLGSRAQAYMEQAHSPRICAELYAEAIERAYARAATGRRALIKQIAQLEDIPQTGTPLLDLAPCIAASFPELQPARRLYVDVSNLCFGNDGSDNALIAQSLLRNLLLHPPAGYRVEPVYLCPINQLYRHASRFTLEFLGCSSDAIEEGLIEPTPGDFFLGLGLNHSAVSQEAWLEELRRRGVAVHFVVYDPPVAPTPQHLPVSTDDIHRRWLEMVAEMDGAFCISRSVADGLRQWLDAQPPREGRPLAITHVRLGRDVDSAPLGEQGESGNPDQSAWQESAEQLRSLILAAAGMVAETVQSFASPDRENKAVPTRFSSPPEPETSTNSREPERPRCAA